MAFNYVPPRLPLINLSDGTATREFYLFLQQLFSSTTGIDISDIDLVAPVSNSDAIGAQLSDLAAQFALMPVASALVASSVSDDVSPAAQQFFVSIDDVLPVIGSLRDEVAMLRAEIGSLQQGGVSPCQQ